MNDHQFMFVCAVLGCGRIAQTTYVATEDGELAGWAWARGDELHFCWPHARNIHNGRDPLWDDGRAAATMADVLDHAERE